MTTVIFIKLKPWNPEPNILLPQGFDQRLSEVTVCYDAAGASPHQRAVQD